MFPTSELFRNRAVYDNSKKKFKYLYVMSKYIYLIVA